VATIAADGQQRGVAVGRVFGRGFATIGHNPGVTAVLALLFAALPTAVTEYLLALPPWDASVVTVGSLNLPGSVGQLVAEWFTGITVAGLAQGALTRPVVGESEGRKARLGECLAAVLPVLPRLILVGAVTAVAVLIGFTLLIIPGLLVYALWSMAPSALVEEREGLFLALSRSQELGAGARWKVIGVILTLDVMVIAAGIGFGVLAVLLIGPERTANSLSPEMMLLSGLFNLVWFLLSGSILASLYVELRRFQEGDSVGKLEEVFA